MKFLRYMDRYQVDEWPLDWVNPAWSNPGEKLYEIDERFRYGDPFAINGDVPLNNVSCAVYRFFNPEGALLYVGIASDPFDRFVQHLEGEKPWWDQWAWKSVRWYPTRTHAAAVELHAIAVEVPAYNIQGQAEVLKRPRRFDDEVKHRVEFWDQFRPPAWQLNQLYAEGQRSISIPFDAFRREDADGLSFTLYELAEERMRWWSKRPHAEAVAMWENRRRRAEQQRDERLAREKAMRGARKRANGSAGAQRPKSSKIREEA